MRGPWRGGNLFLKNKKKQKKYDNEKQAIFKNNIYVVQKKIKNKK